MNLENKLKTRDFWLRLGVINHSIALLVVAFGCVASGFSCQGESMKSVLSLYAFTVFTPQVALEAILLMALFLVSGSAHNDRKSSLLPALFIGSLLLLVLFAYWQ